MSVFRKALRSLGLRNKTLRSFGFLLLLAPWQARAADPRPNILLILSDDQGYEDVGVQGCQDFATPQLDSIAAWNAELKEPFALRAKDLDKERPRKPRKQKQAQSK